MKKVVIFCALCCASLTMLAQTSDGAQRLVQNIVTIVDLSPEQVEQLHNAAEEYLIALQQTKQQYADDTERTRAKAVIFQSYQSSLQEILTEEQYDELIRVREERINQHLTNN